MVDVPIKTEIEVSVQGDSFNFKVPTLHDEIKIGLRMKAIRSRYTEADADGIKDTSDEGLDGWTNMMLRACANFEVLLKTSSAKWVFSSGKDGKPFVDSANFPSDKVNQVIEAHVAFNNDLATFRKGGNPAQPPADEKAVAGQPDPGV